MFSYAGGAVSRKELEEAINIFVKIEEECQNEIINAAKENRKFTDYEIINDKYDRHINEIIMAEKAVMEYGKQIHPNDLASMQDEFYKIVNFGSDVRRSVAYSLLSRAWSGIGEWIK